ncbi:prohead protease/major capsid protein fusion protein [Azospirillum canadense]|uniref:prohead protease/major capsid protein fusion protein n=1 Tax=Azospirillum canadense TaxID=403962 RepID=UPI002225D769|nr:prohead protease/major capsid protein fusion protein [Azospirillum canadense]MCW2242247.1 hypothetical protein [Azospirillum canadense]
MTTPTQGAAPGGAASQQRGTPDQPIQMRAANLEPASFNADDRTVELVASTGATVRRYDWWTGEQYDEVLLVTADAVDLTRFEAGSVPILNAHSQWEVKDIMGAAVPGTARFESGSLILTAKLSSRDDVAGFAQDVADGIIRNVSVGYRVLGYEVDETTKPKTRTITKWELLEVSFVPVGADGAAGTRALPDTAPAQARHAEGAQPAATVNVTIDTAGIATAVTDAVSRAVAAHSPHQDSQGDTRMSVQTNPAAEPTPSESPIENRSAPPQPAAPAPAPAPDLTAIRAAEDARLREIRSIAANPAFGVGDEMLSRAITDGTSVADFRAVVLEEMGKRHAQQPETHGSITIVRDEGQTRADSVVEYLLYRTDPNRNKLTERARGFVGCSMVELAREFVGGGARGLDRAEIVRRAMHTTSDFPYVLGATLRRTLRTSYESVALTFTPFARRTTLADFRATSRVRLGAAPSLLKVNEAGEIKAGSFKDTGASIQLETYARQLRVTRQMLINDDLSAFTQIPVAFGAAAARLQNDLVWGLITSNPVLADGNPLFDASHGNLAAAGTALSVKSIATADAAMGKQQDDNGADLNLMLRWLLVPRELRQVTDTIIAGKVTATKADDAVPAYMTDLGYVTDGRLSRASATSWYGVCDPNAFDTLEFAYLEGEEGVQTTDMEKVQGVDGLAMEARLDFAAAIIDHRGFYKNPGA